MKRRGGRLSLVAVAVVSVVAVYGLGYVVARASHGLLRTGVFVNERSASGELQPAARWAGTEIGRPPGATDKFWLETMFAPAIAAECWFWNGSQLAAPGP